MKALSLLQPWAFLMANGHKNIENRSWFTNFRGPVLIHASKGWDKENFPTAPIDKNGKQFFVPRRKDLPWPESMPEFVQDFERGGIVGIMTITDCVYESDSPWFFGRYGFTVKDARPLPFVPCKGMYNFWKVPEDVVKQLGLEVGE